MAGPTDRPEGGELVRKAGVYGAVTGVAVFAVGWITGMGGGFVANLVFGALMGLFSAACFAIAVRIGGRKKT